MKAQIFPDGGLINRSSIEAMRAWSKILDAHQVEILVAVAAVGPSHWDVRAYLQERFCFSSREATIEPGDSLPQAVVLAA